MSHIEMVNVDNALKTIEEMRRRTSEPSAVHLLSKVEADMKDFLLGMILTALETGLIEDIPERLDELRAKLILAFDSGYILGRESKQ